MTDLDITVAVCTLNNARQLGTLMASLAALRIPHSASWELVVVDNGSNDTTPLVLEQWRGRLPMRIVKELTTGLGQARNAAIDAARGALICWTDDDVEVPPDWLEVYWQAARRHPQAAIFGGRIAPLAEQPATPWFAARLTRWPISSVVACRDLGDQGRQFAPVSTALPWGANFAVRTAVQRQFRYDSRLSLGEETEVVARMLAAGSSGWWVPASKVSHHIRPERQSRRYVARYFRRLGESNAYLYARDDGTGPLQHAGDRWLSAPSAVLALVAASMALAVFASRAAGLLDAELKSLARAHYLRGILDFRREKPVHAEQFNVLAGRRLQGQSSAR